MEEDDEYWVEEDSGSDGGELDFDEEGGAQVRERTGCPPPPPPPPPRTSPTLLPHPHAPRPPVQLRK